MILILLDRIKEIINLTTINYIDAIVKTDAAIVRYSSYINASFRNTVAATLNAIAAARNTIAANKMLAPAVGGAAEPAAPDATEPAAAEPAALGAAEPAAPDAAVFKRATVLEIC